MFPFSRAITSTRVYHPAIFCVDGIDLSTAGFLLPIDGGTQSWAKVSGVLQDGDAHKERVAPSKRRR